MRVVSRLRRFRKLGNKKFAIPVLEHRFPLQIERDIESLPCPFFIRCSDAIKEPHRKVGTMSTNANAAMKDLLASCREVVIHTAKRPAIRELRTSPNPQDGFAAFVRLQQLVHAHDGIEEMGTVRI